MGWVAIALHRLGVEPGRLSSAHWLGDKGLCMSAYDFSREGALQCCTWTVFWSRSVASLLGLTAAGAKMCPRTNAGERQRHRGLGLTREWHYII